MCKFPFDSQAGFDGQLELDPERPVNIDEGGASTKMGHRHGRGPRSQRLRSRTPHGPWKTITSGRLWLELSRPRHRGKVLGGQVVQADGASALRLEDPRLPLMMAAPPRSTDAPEADRTFVHLTPAPGTVFLWESWLRHEVPPNRARTPRISISFNYAWG